MPLFGDALPFPGEDAFLDALQFNEELPVSGILPGVGPCILDVDVFVVKTGAHFSGEQEGPPDPYGADRVEFVGVEEDFGFDSSRDGVASEAVRPDAVGNAANGLLVDPALLKDGGGEGRAAAGMTDFAIRAVFFLPPDVMEESGDCEDIEIGTFLFSDSLTEPEDALRVIPIVAAPDLSEVCPGFFSKGLEPGLFLAAKGEWAPRGWWPGRLRIAHVEIIWEARPSLSLGSNHVDLGGMILPLSATAKSSPIVVGKREKAT